MYVREQHIEVRLSMQKIAANRTRKLLDPEIDWLLNKNQERFIRSKITPKKDASGRATGGFELLQDDLDTIRPLVKRGVSLPAFVGDDRTMRCPLPGDYAYLTQDESSIKRVPYPYDPATTINLTRYLLLLPLKKSIAPVGPYYGTVQISLSGSAVFDLGQFAIARDATTFQGFSSAEEIYALHGYILQDLIDKGWEIYWERYQDQFYPHTFIVVTGAPITGSVKLDANTYAGIQASINLQTRDLPQVKAEYQANRLTASNIISSLLEVSFFGTQPEFPISEITGRSLFVYPNKTFIVSNTVISYVRKPRRISLILGSDCELAHEHHQLICDLTVEYIKAMIADPSWETKLKDNMERTTLP